MSTDRDYNFFRIDDVLLRAGAAAALVVAALAAGGHLALDAPPFYLLALAPAAALGAGFAVRRRERQTHAIWRTLDRSVSVRVADVVANTDYSRADILRAVRLLNNRGLGFYVWHRDRDTIEDARLGDEYVHVENCAACGAPVGLKVAISQHEVPRCPYCHAAAASGRLNLLKRDAISRLREAAPEPQYFGVPVEQGRRPMSVTLFVVLLVLFWPAAIVYAIHKARGRVRF